MRSALIASLLASPLWAGSAQAQTAPQPLPDNSSIWTIQDENASISSSKVTDRYYVNGLRLAWVSPTDAVPDFLSSLDSLLLGGGQQRIGAEILQQIYTPYATDVAIPPSGDRPYAGVLMADMSLFADTATTRSTVTFAAGLIGPDALGEQIQNGFHDLISQGHNIGWHSQIQDQVLAQITGSRTWRFGLGDIGGLSTDVLPQLAAGGGLLRVYGLGGATFRIGQGLDQDFGVSRLTPGLSGGDVFAHTQDFGWYVFAGGDGQVVGYDATLNGLLLRNSQSVDAKVGVGEGQAGLALLFAGTRLTFSDVVQSQEFQHQKGGLHQFGSLALSVRF